MGFNVIVKPKITNFLNPQEKNALFFHFIPFFYSHLCNNRNAHTNKHII